MKTGLKLTILLMLFVLFSNTAAAAEDSLFKIELSENSAEIGDIVHIKSVIPLKNSGYIFLFMTGPGLPKEGVPIEGDIRHSKFSYDKEYLSGSVFEKDWDTSLIIGGLEEGEYTIYISTKDQNALDPEEGTFASAKINITDTKNSKHNESPLSVFVIALSLILSALIATKKKSSANRIL